MPEKKIGYNEAYSLKTPADSIKLYKKWAQAYDEDFALSSNYLSPKKISSFFNKNAKNSDTPILDVGAGTGLVGECLYKIGNKKITARQNAPKTFEHVAGLYYFKKNYILKCKNLFQGKIFGYYVSLFKSFDIDSLVDFKLVELILKNNKKIWKKLF